MQKVSGEDVSGNVKAPIAAAMRPCAPSLASYREIVSFCQALGGGWRSQSR